MDKFPITINGEKKLREELDNLMNIERPKIIDAIAAHNICLVRFVSMCCSFGGHLPTLEE